MTERTAQVLLFDSARNWKLPAKGTYPEREMLELTYFDLEAGSLERISVEAESFQAYGIVETDYSKIGSGKKLPILTFGFTTERKGRYTIEDLTSIENTGKELTVK